MGESSASAERNCCLALSFCIRYAYMFCRSRSGEVFEHRLSFPSTSSGSPFIADCKDVLHYRPQNVESPPERVEIERWGRDKTPEENCTNSRKGEIPAVLM